MTTTHSESQRPTRTRGSARSDEAGLTRRRRRRRAWSERVAQVLCVVLAGIGTLPFLATLVIRSAWARDWAAAASRRLLETQRIEATFAPSLRVWPLALELDHVRVESTDGGGPAVECTRILVRPKLFALLAGKLAIDAIDLDGPKVRAVVRGGEVVNLAIPDTGKKSSGPTRPPFNVFSVTDASLDLDVDSTRFETHSLDLDVTAEDDEALGASFEVSVRTGRSAIHRPRQVASGGVAVDDDALCSLEGRVRVGSGSIVVRRLDAVASADLDAAPGTTPPCDLPPGDKRRVELTLGHAHVELPKAPDELPRLDGHVHVRLPIALAERAAKLPETDGWVGVDADVRYASDTILPEVTGTVEAHDVRLDQYAFAQELTSEVSIRGNVISSPRTTIHLGNGTVTLLDTVVAPLAKGVRLEHTHLESSSVDFTALLRNLGVHPNSWVGWDLRELHGPVFSGTLVPLKLDGDITAKTYSFGVYDRPADDRARERLFGFSEAQLACHVSIRPDALKFLDVHATLPHSRVDGGYVSIGFHNDLRIDVPHLSADFADLSPIGPVTLHGRIEARAGVTGTFKSPEPEGDVQSITGFAVSDVTFGDVSAGHVKVDVDKPDITLTGLKAKIGTSSYEPPTAKPVFGGAKGFTVDAVGASPGFGLRDLLSMFALADDPRFAGVDARMATTANVHVALGGPEDVCGDGYLDVSTKGHLTNVALYGETFAQGDADVGFRWFDRRQGIAGADVDVRSFVLDKVQAPQGHRAAQTGTLLGSASIRRGGALAANVMVEGLPLSRIDSLGKVAGILEGSASGVAHVSGNLDDSQPNAGFLARAEIDVAGTRVRGIALPSSHLDVTMTQTMPQQTRSLGRTRCGAPIPPAFDKQAYLSDTSSRGAWTVNGNVLGDMVHLSDVAVTRARASHMTGRVALRALDLGLLTRILSPAKEDQDSPIVARGEAPVGGQLWGELIVDDLPIDTPAKTNARFFLGPTILTRAGRQLALRPPKDPIALADDTLTIAPLEMTLDTGATEGATGAFHGGFLVSGNVNHLTTNPALALDVRLDPIDLALLSRLVPKVDRASGSLEGNLHLTGKASSPTVSGDLHARSDDIEVHGFPSAITDLSIDVRATGDGLTASGAAKVAGGTASFQATAPTHGLDVGNVDARMTVRDVRLTPEPGVSVALDADLGLAFDPTQATQGTATSLPRISGDILIQSLDYTRAVMLNADLASLATRAKRTVVETYDPALDFVALDLHVRSRAPMVIKNNLIEVQLAVDSGTLDVTGTNQRIGLRGALRAVPGGRFHFQASDFEVQHGVLHFDDPTRIAPNVDITAVTEYRRYTDTSAGAAAGAGASDGPAAASAGGTRGGSLWRITLHAYGDADNLKVDMTSEPALSQEDIVLLLTVGMTRAELDQLQASSLGASIALNYLGAASGADKAVKQALPIIDDFRFGSAYSTVTGKTEPQLTVGKRLTNDVRASVTAGLSEDRELRSNIEWRLNNRLSVQGSYDNINDVSSSALGNLGVDLRWRLEFE
jgi:translocation and assembly module TamB